MIFGCVCNILPRPPESREFRIALLQNSILIPGHCHLVGINLLQHTLCVVVCQEIQTQYSMYSFMHILCLC